MTIVSCDPQSTGSAEGQGWTGKKHKMSIKDKESWIINIQYAADEVASQLGYETVKHILRKYGASSIEDLSPSYYTEVFDELDFIANDLR